MIYQILKKIAKKLFPKKFLITQEALIRQAFAWYYKGNKYTCNICNVNLANFIKLENGDLLCPACGSLPRNRRLWQVLNNDVILQGKVLDFSPSRCLYRKMKAQPGIDYVSSDFAGEFLADVQYDITNIPESHNEFDIIICFHVLEHVEQDLQAMRELFRILKPGGKCLIQTPFKEGDTYENQAIQTPEARLQHFGQEDHVRIYSVPGLKKRLEQAGFQVNINRHQPDQENRFGLKSEETILTAAKLL